MPNVIYDKIIGDPLLYTNIRLQFADQSLCYPKGILEDVIIRVGQSYVPIDFVVLEIGRDERAPIIFDRPFLSTAKAIIYVDTAKICFTIKDKKKKFSFKDSILYSLLIHRRHTCPKSDEDIATLDTVTLWSFPSCNLSPTQLPRHPRIQQTRRHCFGHNSLIRHQNGTFLDALERGRQRRRFGSSPSSRRSMDHSV
jgi:hypothetical protein